MSDIHLERTARDKVTTIIISDGRDLAFLDETLLGVAEQTHQSDRVIVGLVSLESAAVQPLETHLDDYVVSAIGEQENLGAAIKAALSKAGEDSEDGWYWVLHADSAPAPTALDRLLRVGEHSNRIGAVGPKQIGWESARGERELLEVGIRATRSARRVPEIEVGERDQGQYDSRDDVLAVGTAGMLIRKSAWRELDGFNPHLGPFGDGLEFSRRLRHAGYRVVVEPQATVRHARNSLGEDPAYSFGRRRSAQMLNAQLAAPGWLVPLLWLGYTLGSIPRAILRLLLKEPTRAGGEVRAGLSNLAAIPAILQGRRAIQDVREVSGSALRQLEASPAEVRAAKRESRRSRAEARALALLPDPLTLSAQSDLRRHARRGALVTIFFGILLTALLHLPLFAQGTLAGGQITHATATAGDLWDVIRSGWLPTGDGYPLPVDSLWVAFLPLLALGMPIGLTLGQLITAIIYAAIPLSALTGYLAVGRLTKSWHVRVVLGLLWSIGPPMLESLAGGRIASVIIHILLPLLVFAVVGAWRGSSTMLGLSALTLGLLSTASPMFLLASVALAAIGLVYCRGARKRWLWLPLPALGMLAPAIRQLDPSEITPFLFSMPGKPVASPRDPSELLDLFSLRSVSLSNDLDWLLYIPIGILLVAAVFALVRRHRQWPIRLGWAVMVVGFSWALIATRTEVGHIVDGLNRTSVVGWAGVGLSVFWLGLILVLANGSDALRTSLRTRSFGLAHVIGGLLMALVPLTVPAMAGQWIHLQLTSTHNDLTGADDVLPAMARESQSGPNSGRVLALVSTSDGIEAEVWRRTGIEIHEFSTIKTIRELNAISNGEALSDNESLATGVVNLTSGSQNAASQLAAHAITVVLVPPSDERSGAEHRGELIAQLHAVAGLEYVTDNETGTFWRVRTSDPPPARLHTSDGEIIASGTVEAHGEIAGSIETRELALAERADEGWVATINGDELQSIEADLQTWEIPRQTAGEVHVTYSDTTNDVLVGIQLLTMIVTFIVALPLRTRKGSVE